FRLRSRLPRSGDRVLLGRRGGGGRDRSTRAGPRQGWVRDRGYALPLATERQHPDRTRRNPAAGGGRGPGQWQGGVRRAREPSLPTLLPERSGGVPRGGAVR